MNSVKTRENWRVLKRKRTNSSEKMREWKSLGEKDHIGTRKWRSRRLRLRRESVKILRVSCIANWSPELLRCAHCKLILFVHAFAISVFINFAVIFAYSYNYDFSFLLFMIENRDCTIESHGMEFVIWWAMNARRLMWITITLSNQLICFFWVPTQTLIVFQCSSRSWFLRFSGFLYCWICLSIQVYGK